MKYGNLTIISNHVIGYNRPKVLCQLELIEIPWNMDHRKIANLLNSYL